MEDDKIISRNLNRYNSLTDRILNEWNDYEFFVDYLSVSLTDYLKLLPSFEGYVKYKLIDNQEISLCLYTKILQAICDYIKGKSILAYENMKEAFSCIKDILKRKSSYRYTLNAEYGFKARVVTNKEPTPCKEGMFHIPFELRHKVQDNRFSIHGIPSVYLGQSIYDCYMELGCPSLDTFWVSLFTFTQDKNNVLSANHINLIDLTLAQHDFHILWASVKKDDESYYAALDRLIDDILLWPLIMACAVPCKYPKAPFQQEYIIPQILYELCSEYNEFVGIKYTSTKIKHVDQNIHKHAMNNYALPAHDVRRSGFCPKLASQLMLTMPIHPNQCNHLEIKTENNFSSLGFPILSNMHDSLKKDSIIVTLDKMTIYFDKLMHSFMEGDVDLITPLYGWKRE